MPRVSGYLKFGSGESVDNELPDPDEPVDPDYGIEDRPHIWPKPPRPSYPPGPVDPGFGIPLPPVIYPKPPRPPLVDNSLPTYPVRPSNDLPGRPSIWPKPPTVNPPLPPPLWPSVPIYPVPPDINLPAPPGSVWPPLPPGTQGKLLCFVWIPGIGYRWTVIDPALQVGFPLPPTPEPKKK